MNRVKELRERKGISQRALADAIGVNHTTVLRIETGERKVSSSQALKLAEFFECSIDYLLNVSTRHPDNRLRELRMKKGLTLRGLSQKTGIDFSNLAFCERGQRNFSMNSLSTLADFFGVSTDYLLGRSCEDDYTEPSITDEEVKKKYFKTTPKGYEMVYMPESAMSGKNGWAFVHRIVMAKAIGRDLRPEEVVHHIDGNPSNNNLSNLKLFANNGEHRKYHGEQRRNGMIDKLLKQ